MTRARAEDIEAERRDRQYHVRVYGDHECSLCGAWTTWDVIGSCCELPEPVALQAGTTTGGELMGTRLQYEMDRMSNHGHDLVVAEQQRIYDQTLRIERELEEEAARYTTHAAWLAGAYSALMRIRGELPEASVSGQEGQHHG